MPKVMLRNPTIQAATAPFVVNDLRLYPRYAIRVAMANARMAWRSSTMVLRRGSMECRPWDFEFLLDSGRARGADTKKSEGHNHDSRQPNFPCIANTENYHITKPCHIIISLKYISLGIAGRYLQKTIYWSQKLKGDTITVDKVVDCGQSGFLTGAYYYNVVAGRLERNRWDQQRSSINSRNNYTVDPPWKIAWSEEEEVFTAKWVKIVKK